MNRKTNHELRGLSGLVNGVVFGAAIWAIIIYGAWIWIDAIHADSAPFVRDIKKQVYSKLAGE